ncbi:hypothetical protein [Planomonospora sp. ID82291]|uniref:hypothetical protein n=1 Tax=Planomonospora sp. ID82291 TaxID=2738136 RepID=UPI0018C39F9E|nr:hypothetical protein [Planomonospora sp. ID82291]MBG0813005.1 hypothetical protein [Planomonospora sp. ID82291]
MNEGGALEGKFTPEEALQQIGAVDRRVRRSVETAGLVYLLAGTVTTVYWTTILLGPRWLQISAAILASVLVGTFARYHEKLGVRDRAIVRASRTGGAVHLAYGAMTVATLIAAFFLRPGDPGGGWTALAVTLAVATGLPLLYAGGRILRAPR